MQGGTPSQDASGLRVVATAKHLVAYDLERSTFAGQTFIRHNFTARISMQDFVHYYAAPFRVAVTEAAVHSIMCSYHLRVISIRTGILN
eukprot:COSAG01_NODE_23020_length_831_cov_1.949454_2_plen_89_part_00